MNHMSVLSGRTDNPGINDSNMVVIQDVWADNFEKEMERIRILVERFPYVAMDTEFPGVVARLIGNFKTSSDFHYQTLRANVDLLKIIQVGLTFCDQNGLIPSQILQMGIQTGADPAELEELRNLLIGHDSNTGKPGIIASWQFNFHFSLAEDIYAQDSIELLVKSGIDFKKHAEIGIDVHYFGELLITSGLVLTDDVKWISFHSGYDFGYLLKVLTCNALPAEEVEFFEQLNIYFPCIYDIKFLMKSCKNLKGGLQDVANDLKVQRIGPQHQAGSDSLLTAFTFFKMKQEHFENSIDDSKFLGHLYGLGTSYTTANAS